MKISPLIIFSLFFNHSQFAADFSFSNYSDAVSVKRNISSNEIFFDVNPSDNNVLQDEPLVIVYYGLNESHSRSWAQISDEGDVGVTYFQRFEDSDNEGTLIYRTFYPDGSENLEEVTTGTRLEKSVLLFDGEANPNIFVAQSTNQNQWVDRYYKVSNSLWLNERIINFNNDGGLFIYELSADKGPDGSFHLLLLKSRSNVDSDDYWDAWMNSYLYHLTNATGDWEKELVQNYDMAYTYDHQIKSSSRQDIKVDANGYIHVIFGEQIIGDDDPSRLRYANNTTGNWVIETALNYDSGTRDEAGWLPSLCLDNYGIPYISCMYKKRVSSGSAVFCKLLLLNREGANNWHSEIIADHDDGYYASDGRSFTGGLSHLVFDRNNTPHIIFSDIASAHWGIDGTNRLNLGNIRYAVLENGNWNINTIYRQPLPTGFRYATEMHGMCLLVSDFYDTIRVIGQELYVNGEDYYSCKLLNFSWDDLDNIVNVSNDEIYNFTLHQNYPNPFNPSTLISYSIPHSAYVTLTIYDSLGNKIQTLVSKSQAAGSYSVHFIRDTLSSGIYFYQLNVGNDFTDTKKMVLIR